MSNATENIEELFQRTCVNKFVPELTTSYGNSFLPVNYEKNYGQRVEDFKVFDDDVWVHSYPKSGTTWTQEMVWLIAHDFDFEGAKVTLEKRFPFIILSSLFNFDAIVEDNPAAKKYIEDMSDSVNAAANLSRKPRCIKTHLPWNLLPREIKNKEKQPKMIYVVRNPKDVCVSYYYHYCNFHTYKGNFEEFCELFLADKVMFSPYWHNVMSFWEKRNEPNLLIIKYEDMKADLKSVILKVAAFLNKTVPDDKMELLINHLSFENMKKQEQAIGGGVPKRKTDFIRKGIVGDHKNKMSPEMCAKFDEWIKINNNGVIY